MNGSAGDFPPAPTQLATPHWTGTTGWSPASRHWGQWSASKCRDPTRWLSTCPRAASSCSAIWIRVWWTWLPSAGQPIRRRSLWVGLVCLYTSADRPPLSIALGNGRRAGSPPRYYLLCLHHPAPGSSNSNQQQQQAPVQQQSTPAAAAGDMFSGLRLVKKGKDDDEDDGYSLGGGRGKGGGKGGGGFGGGLRKKVAVGPLPRFGEVAGVQVALRSCTAEEIEAITTIKIRWGPGMKHWARGASSRGGWGRASVPICMRDRGQQGKLLTIASGNYLPGWTRTLWTRRPGPGALPSRRRCSSLPRSGSSARLHSSLSS